MGISGIGKLVTRSAATAVRPSAGRAEMAEQTARIAQDYAAGSHRASAITIGLGLSAPVALTAVALIRANRDSG